MASNNCEDGFDPDGENFEEDTTLQMDITVKDQNDETPKFNEETLFFSMTSDGTKASFNAKAIDKDLYPSITYTATETEVSDDAEGLDSVPPEGWFSTTTGK